ncbi:MAG: radical SAM protein [bacterium]
MKTYTYTLKRGISPSKAFQKKKLASFAVNVGTKCGHSCLYCSTGTMLRMHESFKACGESPFEQGYAIVDPSSPDRVALDAKRILKRGLIQLCTTVDAWSPEAQQYQLGYRCLKAILTEHNWTIRVLTKNANVEHDFSYIKQHRNRVLVGLSITAPPDKTEIIEILEPHASGIAERMSVLRTASSMGLRTYAMFCPLLPAISDAPQQIDELVRFAVECNAEEIFVEPVNQRGPGLRLCQETLELRGYDEPAQAIRSIRTGNGWSHYVVELLKNTQRSVRKYSEISRLRFLLYPKRLTAQDLVAVSHDPEGIIWL